MQQAYQIARDKLNLSKEKNKKSYDKSLNKKSFDVGETVLLLDENVRRGRSRSLVPKWVGPYTIIDKIGEINYKVKMGRNEKVIHGDKLKCFYD